MRPATRVESALLRAKGFFSWGFGSWIHEDDLGDVLTTEDAIEAAMS